MLEYQVRTDPHAQLPKCTEIGADIAGQGFGTGRGGEAATVAELPQMAVSPTESLQNAVHEAARRIRGTDADLGCLWDTLPHCTETCGRAAEPAP